FAHTCSPFWTTAAATDGIRSAWRSWSRRSSAWASGMHPRAECLGHGLERALDGVVVDVEMRDRTNHACLHRARHSHALCGDAVDRVALRVPGRPDVDLHEVRLHELEVDGQPGRGPALGEPARPCVVLGEALDVVVERIEAGGGDDPRLP